MRPIRAGLTYPRNRALHTTPRTLKPPTPAPISPTQPWPTYPTPSPSPSSSPSPSTINTHPNPLASAVKAIVMRRQQAGPFKAGVAAASNSDMFKAPTPDKAPARRWESHLSPESLSRGPCNLKMAARHLKQPGLISLGGGLPSSAYFPFSELSVNVTSPESGFSEAGALTRLSIGKYDATSPLPFTSPSKTPPPKSPSYDLSIALNYAQSTGSAQLLRFLTEHVELVHSPPYADWRCAATIGSTGALEQALRMLCDRVRGDSVVTDEFSFSTALETLAPLGIGAVGVRMDEEGLIPQALDEMLERWDVAARGKRKPHVLYTVPSGQNPTGATMGHQRRREVYAVCQKHDLTIIEDDPYYFLQFSNSSSPSSYLSSLLPSLLSLDTDGRVIRLDSFSKTLVPGSRTGWVTAPAHVVDRFVMHSEVANQGPSGFSQLVLHRLLDETWGHDGFLAWLAHLAGEYARRRDVLVRACEEHLPGVVSWAVPRAGMFIWLKVNHTTPTLSLRQVEKNLFDACIARGVLVAPGSWFHAEKDKALPGLYFRATYAAASEGDMAEAVRRFGGAVKESFRQ